MNLTQWQSLVDAVSNPANTMYSQAVAEVLALGFGPNFGIADESEMNAQQSYISAQAALHWWARDAWYQPNSPLFNETFGGVPILGPNLIPTPNGPYVSGSWAAIAVTETGSHPDPLGGNTAYLLLDTSATSQHYVKTNAAQAYAIGQKYLVSAYIKAGTYTGVVGIGPGGGGGAQMNFDLSAHTLVDGGGTLTMSNFTVTLVNGYYLITGTFNAGVSGLTAAMFVEFDGGGSYTGSGQGFYFFDCSTQTTT
jgi:hypothetical protein